MFATLLIWNIVLAALLAGVVALAGRTRYVRECPSLRHCLWLLVLCKLVTPPLVPLPVLTPNPESAVVDFVETTTPATSAPSETLRESGSHSIVFNSNTPNTVADKSMQEGVPTELDRRPRSIDGGVPSADSIQPTNWIVVLCSISLVVTVALVVRVFVQVRRLSRLLRRRDSDSSKVKAIAQREAQRMGIRQVPSVCVVKSVITPLLWVKQGRPVIVLPDSLLSRLTDEQIACVVTHELAHFARRDHWSSALACFVGCLFWWNPVVWWAQRELRIAQEACCDAMVINGKPTIRRAYAQTLLQVIEFVGDERSSPQLTIGFGEAFSITRRFEMIANERVTHRLPRVTALLVATLFGMACCYPVMAQPANDTDSDPVDRSITITVEGYDDEALGITAPLDRRHDSDQADSSANDTAVLQYKVEFEWMPIKHDATATFKYFDDDSGKGVLTLRAERYPKSSQIEMLKAMHDVKSLTFAKITAEILEHDAEFVTLILESEPFALTTLSAVITDLSKHFKIKQITLSPSMAVQPTRLEASGNFDSETSRSEAELQGRQQEFLDAIRAALPTDVDGAGWQIHLNGYHYDTTKDQMNDSASLRQSVGELIEPNIAPETAPDVAGGVASDNIKVDVLKNDLPRQGQFDLSTLTIVKPPSDGQANPQPDGTITFVPDPGFFGKDSFQYTISDTSGNVSAATTVSVRAVESGLENPLLFGDVNDNGAVTAQDALLVIHRLGESDETRIAVRPDDRGPNFTDVDGNLFVDALDALLVINHINQSAASSPPKSSLDGHWIVQRTIHGSAEHAAAEQFKFYAWTFDATARTLTTQWQTSSGDSHTGVNRFVVNTSTTPKQLTVYGEKSLLQAIYEIDGDTLRIGVFGKSELERPASFEAESTGKAGPLVVFELKRFIGPTRK